MEFEYCLQSGDHDHQEMKIMRQNLDVNQLDGGAEDDDIFYAEIRRQILLLTADDDEAAAEEEDGGDNFGHESRNTIHPKYLSPSIGSLERIRRGKCYPIGYNCNFSGWESKKTAAVSIPNWLTHLWRNNGNGTGVFIPQTNNSRRNQKRVNDKRTKIYKPVENKS